MKSFLRRKVDPKVAVLGKALNTIYEDVFSALSSVWDSVSRAQASIEEAQRDILKLQESDSTTATTATFTGPTFDASASYVVLAATSSLANERVLTAGTGLKSTDGGAGAAFTLSIDDRATATVSGTRFTGPVTASSGLLVSAPQGITGTITRNAAGKSYLVAGTGITITSGSSDQVVFSGNSSGVRSGFPYLAKPSSPDSWNLEASDMTDPDLANNGWTVTLLDTPWTAQTRNGNVDMNSDPPANTYNSTLSDGILHIQLRGNSVPILIYKAVTAAAFTYAAHVWNTDITGSGGNVADFALSDNVQRKAAGAKSYFTGFETLTQYEGTLSGTSFNLFVSTTVDIKDRDYFDTVKYLHFTAASNVVAANQISPTTGRVVHAPSLTTTGRTDRTFAFTPTICGIYLSTSLRSLVHLDYVRRYPLWTRVPT